MGDELLSNLQSYKLQLQQVEAALTTEPDNDDLLKLKKDLSEVLELTKELIKSQGGEKSLKEHAAGTSGVAPPKPEIQWNVGDKCMAISSRDGIYYEGKIEAILPDGRCTVSLNGLEGTDDTQLSLLKPVSAKKLPIIEIDFLDDKLRSKKQVVKQQREYKKKKQQKKAQRMKQLEEEREVEKGKWQDFNSKAFSKNKKGHVKKSIFASPDNVSGRVGVGTCGIGGKPMTDYHQQEKWRKNAM